MRYMVPLLARLLSVLLALTLIGVGVIALVEIVAAWLGAGWTILPDNTGDELRSLHWDDRSVVITLVVIGVVGLLSILFGVWRRPPLTLPVDGEPEAGLDRRAFEQSVRRRLEAIDGVATASVRATSKRLVARLETTRQTGHDELREVAADRVRTISAAQHVVLDPDVHLQRKGRHS